ncbi:major facilitator superfamily domain-containing protein [Aspergillus lucknowensis]|uniref:Major facilitator superfamily domain-containing protein n=1 Tax=Aspergillus lucknowensis TaxID=176173 RepID=A0ABR4LDA8_9EURO
MSTTKPDSDHVERAPDADGHTSTPHEKLSLINSRDADDALRVALAGQGETWTEEEEARVLRKIDWIIVPILFIGSLIGYADGQAFGFAALFGLVEDMQLFVVKIVGGEVVLDTNKYQLAAGITSLGGAIGQYLLLFPAQFLPAGLVYGTIVIYIGVLALLTIVCENFSQIMALRFFYGFSQVVQPLSIIITVMWWKTREQPLRIGFVIAGNALGSLVGTGINFGALKLEGAYAGHEWKWIYVVLGSCALFIGILALLVLPATPMKAWFLSPRERQIAVCRLMSNQTGIHTRRFKWRQGLSAFADPQVYLLCIFSFAFAFSNVAISSFGGYLLTSFGYSQSRALVLSMPASAVAVVCILLAGALGRRFPGYRIVIAIAFILPSLMGNLILWKMPRDNRSGLLGGLYISTTFYGSLVQHYSLLAGNIAGHSKKTVVMGTITAMSALGGFSGPWAYKGDQSEQGYPDGQIATLSLMAASIVAYILLWLYYTYRNQQREALLGEQPESIVDPMIAFMDVTDRDNVSFRYVR